MPLRAGIEGPGRTRRLFAGVAVAACSIWGTALGGEFNAMGDGSDTSNPDLLRSNPCEHCVLDAQPHEWDAPFFDIDWSLALRGAYVRNADGEHYEALAIPSVTLTHQTMRGGYTLSLDAELSKTSTESYRLGTVRAAAEAEYQLDALTAISGNLELSQTQDRAGAPGVSDSIAIAPVVTAGEAELGVTRQFGLIGAGLRGGISRTVYGPTTLTDASVVDNSTQNNWQGEAALRLGYAITPVLTAFIEGSAGYQLYDAPSLIHLEKLDAADYEIRTGLAAEVNSVLEAEGSIGLGLRRFAAPGFADVVSTLYDARVTFRPDETLTLGANFNTSVGAPGPDSAGLARVEYAAGVDASYRLNPWVTLRASAGWRRAQLVGTTVTENGYDAGVGVDYLLNQFATLTADYGYSWAETTPAPGEDEHRVTLGVTFSRPGSER